MDLLANLNPQQRLAVEHGKGPALVLAGAGSGKTRVIAHRIAYLIRNMAARPENILAVTFTNKAAQEMRERARVLVGASRTAEPLVTTFHSFCVRLLRREIHHLGYRKDFSIYDTEDQRKLMKRLVGEAKGEAGELNAREILARISFAKNHGIAPAQYARTFPSPVAENIEELYTLYSARLPNLNALDFDDLLLKTVDVLSRFPRQRDHYSDWYRYILVDEYQDTNRPQYEILRLLTATHENLFVVGDEDQSIYKFRGADIRNILRFEKDFPGARVIKLEQNYRSTRNILRAAGDVVSNNTERKDKTLWTENPAGNLLTCRSCRSARGEADWVCKRIREIQEGEPSWRVGVLYRANYLSRNFEEVLLAQGIPYTIVGSVAFFGRKEIKDLLGYLRILFNPEDDIALLRVINTPPRGIGATTIALLTQTALEKGIPVLQALRETAQNPGAAGRAARAFQRFLALLDGWQHKRDTATLADLLESIVTDVEYREMLRHEATAEEAASRIANLEELILAAAESEERGETVFEFLDRASLSSELDSLDPSAAVTLMTLHSAKGLEFDAVFLAGLEEGLFPHSQSMNTPQDLEEERRLCYVGITRARQKLFLSWARYRRRYGPDAGMPSAASRFLEEMPADIVEGLDEPAPYDWEDAEGGDGAARFEEGDEEVIRTPAKKSGAPGSTPAVQPKTMAELRAYLQKTQRSERPGNDSPDRPLILKPGMRVRHAQFGEGIILKRERAGDNIKLTITFSRVGRKTVVEKYAKLQAL